ncbi:MAG: short-subunit dehydrogenase [Pseudohongiellaceae bacterium]|jgi:short-subunit dehydrogenase
MELRDKTILLTGADGGIGSALSKQLASEGARLFLCSTRQESLEKLVADLGASGCAHSHQMFAADLSATQGRQSLVAACKEHGGIDVLINLAGILDFHLYEDQSAEIIERTIQINMLAPMLLCHELLPQLKDRQEAMILNVGSIFGSIGHPGFVAYCASKAGVKTFTEALSRELDDTAISVSYIAPRATATKLNTDRVNTLNKELGNKTDTPDYVASAIISQLKSGKTLTYLGWPEKLFVRINALLPSVVHSALVKKLALIKQYARS